MKLTAVQTRSALRVVVNESRLAGYQLLEVI